MEPDPMYSEYPPLRRQLVTVGIVNPLLIAVTYWVEQSVFDGSGCSEILSVVLWAAMPMGIAGLYREPSEEPCDRRIRVALLISYSIGVISAARLCLSSPSMEPYQFIVWQVLPASLGVSATLFGVGRGAVLPFLGTGLGSGDRS